MRLDVARELARAIRCAEEARDDDARAVLHTILEGSPGEPLVLLVGAWLVASLGDVPEALGLIDRALGAAPTSVALLADKFKLCCRLDRRFEAVQAAERALRLDPARLDLAVALARVLVSNWHWD